MAKVGRPTKYNETVAKLFCERIANGASLRTVCLDDDMPVPSTIFEWIRAHEEFSKQYARATEERTEAMAEDTLFISDGAVELAQNVDSKASGAVVNAARLQVDTRKWLMSKMKPKKYGDKIDMTTNGKDLPSPIYNNGQFKK